MHTYIRIDSVIRKLEILTRNDVNKKLLVISISDTAKTPIWCNKELPLKEKSILVI